MKKGYDIPKLRRFSGFRYPSAADFTNSDAGVSEEIRLDTEDPRVKARPVSLSHAVKWARMLCPELI